MWTEYIPFALAASLGFRHAFETDHLMAVSNIVTKRNSMLLSMKDGVYWGLGHSSSILVTGIFILSLRWAIPNNYFHFIEGGVGLMIILLGIFRMWQFFKEVPLAVHAHPHAHDKKTHNHPHLHGDKANDHTHLHRLSFGVGIVHGLAGSGVLIATAMTAVKALSNSFLFLVIFSIGSIGGMMIAAALFSLPFSKKLHSFIKVQQVLVVLSCGICVVLGTRIIIEHWLG